MQTEPNIRAMDWGDRIKFFTPMGPSIDYIVIHHSDSGDVPIEEIDRWHRNLSDPFYGVGYQYVIRSNGNVEIGRPENVEGAQCYSYNRRSIGICLCGNFMYNTPTYDQMSSLVWLINDIHSRYPGAEVVGHRDLCSTSCPGDRFPWEYLLEMLKEDNDVYNPDKTVPKEVKDDIIKKALTEGVLNQLHDSEAISEKWFVSAVGMNIQNNLKSHITSEINKLKAELKEALDK